jgi:hypothetical protein
MRRCHEVIACIEDPVVIQKILNHLQERVNVRMRFGCPRVAARHNRVYLGKVIVSFNCFASLQRFLTCRDFPDLG